MEIQRAKAGKIQRNTFQGINIMASGKYKFEKGDAKSPTDFTMGTVEANDTPLFVGKINNPCRLSIYWRMK